MIGAGLWRNQNRVCTGGRDSQSSHETGRPAADDSHFAIQHATIVIHRFSHFFNWGQFILAGFDL